MGAVPDEQGYWVCNTVWMLDDFTRENGPTRWCRVHTNGGRGAGRARRIFSRRIRREVLLTGKAGTIAVMNAHMWHGGTANLTARPRLAMHGFYCRRDKPQQQYQKQLLRPKYRPPCLPTYGA